jgi:hypothetical protein
MSDYFDLYLQEAELDKGVMEAPSQLNISGAKK